MEKNICNIFPIYCYFVLDFIFIISFNIRKLFNNAFIVFISNSKHLTNYFIPKIYN